MTEDRREAIQNDMIRHHENVDPHSEVGASKQIFFTYALEQLELRTQFSSKKILDVGCNYGYFLKMANQRGWQTFGVDIAEETVKGARKLLGEKSVIFGTLKEARFAESSFDAITLWDVLCLVKNPAEEVKECFRVIKEGGKIGIRLSNLNFQKFAYFAYELLKGFFMKIGMKKPYVFHHFCFTATAIIKLLERSGFTNIEIKTSPLTVGDPYGYMKTSHLVRLCKHISHFSAKAAYLISNGKYHIGSSLVVWAEKPISR